MLSVVSVGHSVHRGIPPCGDLPWCIGPHCTGTPPTSGHGNSLYRACASDIWWPILETCSNVFTWGPPPSHLTPDGQDWRPDQTSDGQDWRPYQTCSLEDPLPHPTSGGYWSIYGWQAGGTHPTSMRPRFIHFQTCNSYSFSFFFSRSVT